MKTEWVETTRAHPCPICGKAGWCCVTKDGTVCKCMREAEGAFKTLEDGSGLAFYHNIDPDTGRLLKAILKDCRQDKSQLKESELKRLLTASRRVPENLVPLSEELGLPVGTLRNLGAGWLSKKVLKNVGTVVLYANGAYTFPMFRRDGTLCGFRLRVNGFKYSLKGGTNGFFMERKPIGDTRCLNVVEGPTDMAAGMAYGMKVIGRPNNTAFTRELCMLISDYKPERINIIIDNDDKAKTRMQTERGANSLFDMLDVVCPSVSCRILKPKYCKDLREIYKNGVKLDYLRHEMEVLNAR